MKKLTNIITVILCLVYLSLIPVGGSSAHIPVEFALTLVVLTILDLVLIFKYEIKVK